MTLRASRPLRMWRGYDFLARPRCMACETVFMQQSRMRHCGRYSALGLCVDRRADKAHKSAATKRRRLRGRADMTLSTGYSSGVWGLRCERSGTVAHQAFAHQSSRFMGYGRRRAKIETAGAEFGPIGRVFASIVLGPYPHAEGQKAKGEQGDSFPGHAGSPAFSMRTAHFL